jgi:predicted NAD/FAD-binding protein
MRFIVSFYQNHGLLGVTNRPQWRVIRGGSRTYVEAMARRFRSAVRLNSPVVSVSRNEDHVEIRLKSGMVEKFDHVVFACHADQALRMLGEGATPVERELLSAFPYERNMAVLHTDATVLPRSRRAWAAWNYHLPTNNPTKATVTYNMNILQGLNSSKTFCVTLNSDDSTLTDPRQVIRRIEYHHPIYDTRRLAMQRRHPEVIGRHRTSFCGAYWGNGFHEDGVVSALAVTRALLDESWKVASMKVGSDTGDTSRSNTAFATECS